MITWLFSTTYSDIIFETPKGQKRDQEKENETHPPERIGFISGKIVIGNNLNEWRTCRVTIPDVAFSFFLVDSQDGKSRSAELAWNFKEK